MKYYHCDICNDEHAVLEDSDMDKRAVECDNHGHNYNASGPDKSSPTGYWCAYCSKPITKREYFSLVKL